MQLAKVLAPFAATNRDIETLLVAMEKEHDTISRMLGAVPRSDFNVDWYRGRMGTLRELLDGARGNGNK